MSKVEISKVVVRFAGDSGDGIQLVGNQLSDISVIKSGNDIYTFVEFPSEIRAPSGSISGVSGFQVTISSKKVFNVDNKVDLLFVFNPAALKVHLNSLKLDGILIVDIDSFSDKNLKKAGFQANPLESELVSGFKVVSIPITSLTYSCVKDVITGVSKAKRCKNFFALGVVCWIYDRSLDGIINFLKKKFGEEELFIANERALKAGYNYCSNIEMFNNQFYIPSVDLYKSGDKLIKLSGNNAFVYGLVASSFLFNLPLFSANYPITPASDIFHELMKYMCENIKVFQFEDEIAAICSVIGAAYGGSLSFTCTSGPGLDLMQEGLGLAIMAELPVVVLDVQRCGPSTGIPTKSEQTDLLAALFGRHGESSVVVLAPDSPGDCFWTIIEAFCLAVKSLSPVIILSDANLANSAELWKVPRVEDILKKISLKFEFISERCLISESRFMWLVPGFSDEIFCIGGLEKDITTGSVSHDPSNHFFMVKKRFNKIQMLIDYIDDVELVGPAVGEVLIVTWGSVCGIIRSLHADFALDNKVFSFICLRYFNPLPKNLCGFFKGFKNIVVIEENMGQLAFLLKAVYCINVININQVTGKPFDILFIKEKVLSIL